MLRKLGEKLGVINHVRSLFAKRGETFRAASWNCVLRDGRLVVVRSFLKEPTDVLIMDAVLDSDRLPSWYATYAAVTRNWSVIAKAGAAA
ncbi:MAG: hypothetical protein ACYS14_08870 [Planctomycetota bacterium]